MTQADSINKGDKFWCIHRRLPKAMLGTVIVMTDEPGKLVGMEFEDCFGGHSCDGRGKDGHCLWVGPEYMLTEDEYASEQAAKQEVSAYSELPKVVLKS